MKTKIIFCVFCIFIMVFSINIVYGKYVIENRFIVATIQIDRTAPKVEIVYSTKELTKEKVVVTIKANEQIQKIDGWELQEDKKTLKKEYINNVEEVVEIKDLADNITREKIVINNIDNQLPTIDITKIESSNAEYQNYANKDTKITFNIEIKDDNKIEKILDGKDIKILVDNKEVQPKEKRIIVEKDTEKEKQLLLTISGVVEEGELSLEIKEGIIKDKVGNNNLELKKNCNIKIDNTAPQARYSQNKIEEGKVEGKIIADEEIRKLEGWNFENKKVIKKIFNSNLSYTTTIKDLAGNSTNVKIDVIGATYVILKYASHNSEIGWSYGYENYDIAGLEAIKENSKYKTESLAFSISGNVEKDFLQVKAYVYTYWGEGKSSICDQSKQIYYHGWNPSKTNWSSLMSKENITLQGEEYIQFGGTFINGENNTDINGKNPIPWKVAREYKYGISAIQLKLKDYSEYSIVYQIYIDQVGWIEPKKNEEIACYKESSPISAIRIALVPNSELNAILKTWNKDTRKNHLSKEEKLLTC